MRELFLCVPMIPAPNIQVRNKAVQTDMPPMDQPLSINTLPKQETMMKKGTAGGAEEGYNQN